MGQKFVRYQIEDKLIIYEKYFRMPLVINNQLWYKRNVTVLGYKKIQIERVNDI